LTRTVKAETRFRRVDYAGAVFRMDYESFERTALKARQAEPDPCKSICELVRRHDPSAGEAELVEALSRNLARGRVVMRRRRSGCSCGRKDEHLLLTGRTPTSEYLADFASIS